VGNAGDFLTNACAFYTTIAHAPARGTFSSGCTNEITAPQQSAEVAAASRSKPVPWSNSSLVSEVYLAAKP
jgi:hypothetical protein